MGLLPCGVAIVSDLLAVASGCSRSASFARPGGLDVSLCGQFDARNRIAVCVCCSGTHLLGCFDVSVFSPPASLHPNPLNCEDLRTRSLILTHPLSSDSPGVLGVSSQGQFDVRNRSPRSASRLMSSLLTYFAVYVCEDTRRFGLLVKIMLFYTNFIGNPLNCAPESHRWRSGQCGLVILEIQRPRCRLQMTVVAPERGAKHPNSSSCPSKAVSETGLRFRGSRFQD